MEDDDKYPLIWNIRYAMRFGRRQSKLLDRVAFWINATTFTAGTTAFVSVIGDNQGLMRWAAFLTGVLGILGALWNPAGRAAKSRELAMRYSDLNRDAPKMTREELQREYDNLYNPGTPEIEALRPVAYNDTVAEFGNSPNERCPLGWRQKLFARLTGGSVDIYDDRQETAA